MQQTVDNTCGDTGTPSAVTGTVTHTPGAEAFVLADTGGTTFTGTVQTTGDFTATRGVRARRHGQHLYATPRGPLHENRFTGRLGVDVSPRACRFTRDWTRDQAGLANVLP